MSFLLECPHCGPRPVGEFAYGGELGTEDLYLRANVQGVQREAWFHRFGCEVWFEAERDTRTNEVLVTR